jgi:enoyl-CoA hydratase
MGYETISLEQEEGVWTLTIDRPDALNALNQTVLEEVSRAMDELVAKKARGLVLRGAGEKAFAAGADIKAMKELGPEEAEAFARVGQEAFFKLEEAPFPSIAAVRGFALGGGLELAMSADLIVAGEGAKLGQPEVTLGLVTGFAGSMRLPRLVGPARAKDLLMSGRMLGAEEAYALGLVARVVPDEELFESATKMVRKMAGNAPLAVAAIKRLVNEGAGKTRQEAADLEARVFGEMFATKDHTEGIEAFLGKRKPSWQGE